MEPLDRLIMHPYPSAPGSAEEWPLCSDLSHLPVPAARLPLPGETAAVAEAAGPGSECAHPQALPAWMGAEWPHWADEVQRRVTAPRWAHVKRVAVLAAQIAYANGLDTRRAYAAGILHDVARDLSGPELLQLAPPECDLDGRWPLAVHGRAARHLLETLGFTDQTVLDAVEDHVTGPRPGHAISACVYIADVSEPGRGVNEDIRALALHDLGAALELAIGSKVRYLTGRGTEVHPRTLALYQWIQEQSGAPASADTGARPAAPGPSPTASSATASSSTVSSATGPEGGE